MPTLDPRLHAYREDLADARLEGKVEADRFVAGAPRQVVLGVAPLRKAPTPGTSLSSELLFGESVLLFEERDGVAWVQNETDGYVGYTDSAALSGESLATTHHVSVVHTCLYPEPHIRAPAAMILPMGAALAVTGSKGRYCELATGGWVPEPHIEPADSVESDPVAVAERFTGVPYVWGGRSYRGLDCSALVQLSCARCGVGVPRDSDMQEAALGKPVAFDGDQAVLKRGDLVFWKGHVGIWIDADRFLHANATDMCVRASPFEKVFRHIEDAEGLTISSIRRV